MLGGRLNKGEDALSENAVPEGDVRSGSGSAMHEAQEHSLEPAELPFSRARVFLVFFVLAAGIYFQTVGCHFLWDEYRLILGNAQAGAFDWGRLPDLFSQRYFHLPGSFRNDLPLDLPFYRPVTVLIHGLTYKVAGPSFPVFHLESIFLHLGNALLLFSLFSVLLRRCSSSPHRESIALAGAALFLVHPRNVETVSIIANQTGLLSAFFCLLSVLLWARLLDGARRPVALYGLSLASLLLAMLCKETAYAAPLVHGLVLLLLGKRDRKSLLLLCGFFLLPLIPLVARQTFIGGRSILDALSKQLTRQGAAGGYVTSIFYLLFHQLYTWLLPMNTEMFQYPFSVKEMPLQQILLPLLVLFVFCWRLREEKAALAFGIGWFAVLYLPSSNLISIGTLPGGDLKAGAHHLYPAHAGLCLLLAAAIFVPLGVRKPASAASRAGRMQWPVLTLLILLLGVQSFRFAANFRSPDRFYQNLLDRHPLHTGAWTNYGWHKLYIDKDPEAAERILLGGIEAVGPLRNEKAKMDFIHHLLLLYLDNGHALEAETLLQCITNPWIVRPVGSIYFWHAVTMLNQSADRSGSAGETAAHPGG